MVRGVRREERGGKRAATGMRREECEALISACFAKMMVSPM